MDTQTYSFYKQHFTLDIASYTSGTVPFLRSCTVQSTDSRQRGSRDLNVTNGLLKKELHSTQVCQNVTPAGPAYNRFNPASGLLPQLVALNTESKACSAPAPSQMTGIPVYTQEALYITQLGVRSSQQKHPARACNGSAHGAAQTVATASTQLPVMSDLASCMLHTTWCCQQLEPEYSKAGLPQAVLEHQVPEHQQTQKKALARTRPSAEQSTQQLARPERAQSSLRCSEIVVATYQQSDNPFNITRQSID